MLTEAERAELERNATAVEQTARVTKIERLQSRISDYQRAKAAAITNGDPDLAEHHAACLAGLRAELAELSPATPAASDPATEEEPATMKPSTKPVRTREDTRAIWKRALAKSRPLEAKDPREMWRKALGTTER